ncbi:MAG: HNH endonuclease signature motif containing protein [Caldilineaceae bacterium]
MPSEYIPVALARLVIERADGRCEYCQSRADYATEDFAVDHIWARSRGGKSVADNLAYACSGCNGRKYNKSEATDPIDGMMAPLYNPRTQMWSEHFTWDAEFTRIIGTTPIGRATVLALQMNRIGVVNLRKALYAIGQHPSQL